MLWLLLFHSIKAECLRMTGGKKTFCIQLQFELVMFMLFRIALVLLRCAVEQYNRLTSAEAKKNTDMSN
jgi:hypothetical protein